MDLGVWDLALAAILLVAFLLGVFSAGSFGELSRLGYAVRMLPLAFVKIALFASLPAGGSFGPGVTLIAGLTFLGSLFLLAPVLVFLECRWSALRLNQLGWSRWLAFVTALPVVSLIFVILLAILPPPRPAQTQSQTLAQTQA